MATTLSNATTHCFLGTPRVNCSEKLDYDNPKKEAPAGEPGLKKARRLDDEH
jgi:hypothetical protein